MRLWVLAALLLLAVAPGFATPAPGSAPYQLGHNHRDAAIHQASSNMALKDWEPMGGTPLTMAGAHAVEAAGGVLFVAAWGEQFGAGGLWLYDVATDPHNPTFLSRVALPGPIGGDRALGVTPDGHFAVLGVENVPSTLYWGAPANPTPPGIVLIDARDPTNPLVAGYAPANLGVHSVTMHRIGGVDYVYPADLGSSSPSVYRIETQPVPRLAFSSIVGGFAIGHDASPYDDPALGRPLLATADGYDYHIWDLADPERPALLATWEEQSTYTHSALLTTIEGRRVLIASSEDWGPKPSTFWLIDATDFDDLQLIGSWSPPVAAGPGWLRFSLHNPRIVDGTLWFAHYHAGVVAFDVSTLAKAANPQMVAFANVAHDTGYVSAGAEVMKLRGAGEVHAPFVMDVEIDAASGALYAADTFFGVATYATR